MATTQAVNFTSIFPDLQAQQIQAQRQQELAQAIMQQGMQQSDPTRNAGMYTVPISQTESFSKLAQTLLGSYLQKQASDKQIQLGQASAERMYGLPWQQPGYSQQSAPLSPGQTGTNVTGMPWQQGISPSDYSAMFPPQQPAQSGPISQPMGGGQPPQQQGGGLVGQIAPPGMPPQQQMLAMALAPDAFMKAAIDRYTPTDTMKNYQQAGMSPQAIAQAIQGKANAEGTINARAGSFLQSPNGQSMIVPDLSTGMAGGVGPNGVPYAYPIPGATAARFNMGAAAKGGETYNTIIPDQTINGVKHIPTLGSYLMAKRDAENQPPPDTGPRPPQWNGPNDPGMPPPQSQSSGMPYPSPVTLQGAGDGSNQQIQPPQNVASGQMSNVPSPQSSLPPSSLPKFGMTAADEGAQEAQGKNIAAANEAYQKQKALMPGIDAALNELQNINPSVPSGNYGLAEAKAKLSNTVSPLFGADPTYAKSAQRYNQLMNDIVISGLKSMSGSGIGQLRVPEINAINSTYKVDMDNDPKVRAQGINDLRTMIHNKLAAAQNTLNGLNTPAIPQVTPGQVTPYGNAGATPGTPQVTAPTTSNNSTSALPPGVPPPTRIINGRTIYWINGGWYAPR